MGMADSPMDLPFERGLKELEKNIAELSATPDPSPEIQDAIQKLRFELNRQRRDWF